MILGMAFSTPISLTSVTLANFSYPSVRNVYVLFDYGDFIAGSTKQGSPYIKMLSVTNRSDGKRRQSNISALLNLIYLAHLAFVDVRLGGIDTTGSKGLRSINADESTKSRITVYVIASILAGLLILVGMKIIMVYRRKKILKHDHNWDVKISCATSFQERTD